MMEAPICKCNEAATEDNTDLILAITSNAARNGYLTTLAKSIINKAICAADVMRVKYSISKTEDPSYARLLLCSKYIKSMSTVALIVVKLYTNGEYKFALDSLQFFEAQLLIIIESIGEVHEMYCNMAMAKYRKYDAIALLKIIRARIVTPKKMFE
jgi:Trk K+ transport system NAD-binding subunit